jgi:glucose/arabinose dehydrogenase
MRNTVTNTPVLSALVVAVAMCVGISLTPASNPSNATAQANSQSCPNDDGGLKLPAGFCATIFADDVGHARHMAVAPSGVLYVNTCQAGTTATKRRMQAVSS